MESNVTLKQITLSLKKVEQLASIIEEELIQCMDTQIFVEQDFFDEIWKNDVEHHIYRDYYKYWDSGSHYGDDCEEKYGFHKDHAFSDLNAQIHFVSNCNGYHQLCLFSSKQIKKYIHYLHGMKQIIIIHAEKE